MLKLTGSTCEACKFYEAAKKIPNPVSADVRGVCRRFPAALAKLPHEWCGEFKEGSPA